MPLCGRGKTVSRKLVLLYAFSLIAPRSLLLHISAGATVRAERHLCLTFLLEGGLCLFQCRQAHRLSNIPGGLIATSLQYSMLANPNLFTMTG